MAALRTARASRLSLRLKSRGVGKGTLGEWGGRITGRHGLHLTKPELRLGRFSAHRQTAIYIFADENFFAGDRRHESVLKALFTEKVTLAEQEFVDPVMSASRQHVLMASNAGRVEPASADERRFCVLAVSSCRVGDRAFFHALNKQMENGVAAAMLHDLLAVDISKFEGRDVPRTRALADPKRKSLDSLGRW